MPIPLKWKELCYLWSSDFRTHLTDSRWNALCTRLEMAEAKWSEPTASVFTPPVTEPSTERHINIETPMISARLDRRRGLALERLRFDGNEHAVVGGLPHGYFDEIALQADWYTGDCVFESPGEHKITDLEWCEARIEKLRNGDVVAHARIETPKGPIEKQMRFSSSVRQIRFRIYLFHWREIGAKACYDWATSPYFRSNT